MPFLLCFYLELLLPDNFHAIFISSNKGNKICLLYLFTFLATVRITSPAQNHSVQVGSSVMMPCVVNADVATNVTWFSNGKQIKSMEKEKYFGKYTILPNNSLIISNPRIALDGRKYHCVATFKDSGVLKNVTSGISQLNLFGKFY